MRYDHIVIGAGVIGSAAAYHLKRSSPDSRVLLIDMNGRAGAGNTSRSAALYRNIFSSRASRDLSTSSIRYYLELGFKVQMNPIGYLWMFSGDQWERSREAVSKLDPSADELEFVDRETIGRMLKINTSGSDRFPPVKRGILGHLCGSMSGMELAQHYTAEFESIGGEMGYDTEIIRIEMKGAGDRFAPWSDAGIETIADREGKEYSADSYVFCTGAWTHRLLSGIGIYSGVLPKKRQLFGIKLDDPYQAAGDIDLDRVPAMILPAGGTYIKPMLHKKLMLLGLADDLGQPYDMDDPNPDPEFFGRGLEPVLNHYFPDLKDYELKLKWAGYYSYHWPDKNPVVENVSNIYWASGTSGPQ
ncbi:MAG: NAD(P)/FAD-dependent oxidoreductase [Thermoplasmatota archaeon]